MKTTHTEPHTADNVRATIHRSSDLRDAVDRYDQLARSHKLRLAREVEPIATYESHNLTTEAFHEYQVANLRPSENENETITHIALGDDDTDPDTSNTTLNNRRDTVALTDIVNQGRNLLCSTFLDATEANDIEIKEVGLVTNDDDTPGEFLLVNHALLDEPVDKTDQITATVDVTLRFRDHDEVAQ